MIESVEIENLRGIREGKVSGLRPLTILVGPNGSGKSTVLDSLLIGAHPLVGEAVGRTIRRRRDVDAARWLFVAGEADTPASVKAWVLAASHHTTLKLELEPYRRLEDRLVNRLGGEPPFFTIEGNRTGDGEGGSFVVVADREGRYVHDSTKASGARPVRMIDSLLEFRSNPLATDFQSLRTSQADDRVQELTRMMVPDCLGLELGADSKGMATLHLSMPTGTLALSAAGDGVRLAVRLAIDLSSVRSGVALLEEPEAHLHPAAIGRVARVIVEAAARGVQTVVATHSLELIDELLEAAREVIHPDDIGVIRLLLKDGKLAADTITGAATYLAREALHEDLR